MYGIMGGWCSWLSQLSNTYVCTVGPQFKSGSAHFFDHHRPLKHQADKSSARKSIPWLRLIVPVLVFAS